MLFFKIFVHLFFPKTTFVCFSKCLSVRFFSKLHFAVFRNVVRSFFYKLHLLFLKCLSIHFLKLDFSKLHFAFFFEMFVHLSFPKTTFGDFGLAASSSKVESLEICAQDSPIFRVYVCYLYLLLIPKLFLNLR